MSCEAFRELLSAYLDDSLDDVRRAGFRAHLRACDDCRRAAVAEEPTLVFSLVDQPEPPQDRIETCVTSVIAGIRRERLEKRLQPSRRPWFAVAAVIVVAIIAATVWWLNTGQTGQMSPLQANAVEIEAGEPVADGEAAVTSEPPPRVEVDMNNEEVRVYQYAIGDDTTTGAVFIVNPAMEL